MIHDKVYIYPRDDPKIHLAMHIPNSSSNKHVAIRRIQHHRPLRLRDNRHIVVHVRIDPHVRIRTLLQSTPDPQRRKRRSVHILHRSALASPDLKRRQRRRGHGVEHVPQHALTVVFPIGPILGRPARPFAPTAAPLTQDLDLV